MNEEVKELMEQFVGEVIDNSTLKEKYEVLLDKYSRSLISDYDDEVNIDRVKAIIDDIVDVHIERNKEK